MERFAPKGSRKLGLHCHERQGAAPESDTVQVRSSNTGNVWYKLHVLCFTNLSLEISSCLEVTAL